MNPASFDLSGTWRGHYVHAGTRHGIAMEITQEGLRIQGTMRDEHTVFASTETIPSPEPWQPPEDVELLITLPESSEIRGEVLGERVSFVKRYLGGQSIYGRSEDHEMSVVVVGHRVFYAGRIEAEGAVLRGRWTIPPMVPGDPAEEDEFELLREPGAPPRPSAC